jgi:hypothetical protein
MTSTHNSLNSKPKSLAQMQAAKTNHVSQPIKPTFATCNLPLATRHLACLRVHQLVHPTITTTPLLHWSGASRARVSLVFAVRVGELSWFSSWFSAVRCPAIQRLRARTSASQISKPPSHWQAESCAGALRDVMASHVALRQWFRSGSANLSGRAAPRRTNMALHQFSASQLRLSSTAARPTLVPPSTAAALDDEDTKCQDVKEKKPDRVERILKSLGMHSSQLEAGPDFNRWKLIAAATTNHMCLGSIYAWSLFNQPLTRLHGVVAPGPFAHTWNSQFKVQNCI